MPAWALSRSCRASAKECDFMREAHVRQGLCGGRLLDATAHSWQAASQRDEESRHPVPEGPARRRGNRHCGSRLWRQAAPCGPAYKGYAGQAPERMKSPRIAAIGPQAVQMRQGLEKTDKAFSRAPQHAAPRLAAHAAWPVPPGALPMQQQQQLQVFFRRTTGAPGNPCCTTVARFPGRGLTGRWRKWRGGIVPLRTRTNLAGTAPRRVVARREASVFY